MGFQITLDFIMSLFVWLKSEHQFFIIEYKEAEYGINNNKVYM